MKKVEIQNATNAEIIKHLVGVGQYYRVSKHDVKEVDWMLKELQQRGVIKDSESDIIAKVILA